MNPATAIVSVFHVVGFVIMAAPMYMLIIVNERLRMGPPDAKLDRYMENIISRNAVRCFVIQETMLVTGLLLLWLKGYGLDALVSNFILPAKLMGLLALMGILGHVHLVLQPKINRLVDTFPEQGMPAPEVLAQLRGLRQQRKRLSAICLFIVLALIILGLRLTMGYNMWLALLLVVLAALFAWRVYRSLVPYGWV